GRVRDGLPELEPAQDEPEPDAHDRHIEGRPYAPIDQGPMQRDAAEPRNRPSRQSGGHEVTERQANGRQTERHQERVEESDAQKTRETQIPDRSSTRRHSTTERHDVEEAARDPAQDESSRGEQPRLSELPRRPEEQAGGDRHLDQQAPLLEPRIQLEQLA